MAPLLNQGYLVIMDNSFSSADLFYKLCSKQTATIGTFHKKRKGIPAEKERRTEKGEDISV
jgi:hypothetical protein